MKKIYRYISTFMVLFVGVLLLVGCKSNNFYKEWKKAGANIPKDHIFEVISLDKAKEKIDNDETFVLVFASSTVANSVSTISTLQAQAEYFSFSEKIYFVNATKYIDKIADRKTAKEALGIYDPSTALNTVILVCYNDGEVLLDTSDKTDDNMADYLTDDAVDFEKLSSYIFNDFNFN